MALRPQASFSGGELDPALHERTTLQKFRDGLATARNVIVGRTGRILTRPTRYLYQKTKLDASQSILYALPRSNLLLEWGHQYVRIYDLTGAIGPFDLAHAYTAADIPNLTFETRQSLVYITCPGKTMLMLYLGSLPFIFFTASVVMQPWAAPVISAITVTGTGPEDFDYVCTIVVNKEESLVSAVTSSGKSCINPGEKNRIDITHAFTASASEFRVYRRPKNGGAFGYVGSSSYFTGGHGYFDDFGGEPDYDHSPPVLATPVAPSSLLPQTIAIYQQRLISTYSGNLQDLYASRPGFPNDFYQDNPVNAASALAFRSGSSGQASVLRMIDSDGLVVFTTAGVFLHTGALSPTNLTLDRKGNWVIDYRVPPLAIPGGVLFIDSSTNTVRILSWSTEQASYSGEELSVFSGHLFSGKLITSWAFQEGDLPLLWVTFNDGTYATFTYERDQAMRAWTRHDTGGVDIEFVCSNGFADQVFFIVKKGDARYIERTSPRYVPAAIRAADPEWDKNPSSAAMDSVVWHRHLLNEYLAGADQITVVPAIDPDNWDTDLIVDCGTSALFPSPGDGAIGAVLRYFDSDGASYDLEVTARHTDSKVACKSTPTFPSTDGTGPRLYRTTKTVTGLDHLEGESVSVMVDGGLVASPNNVVEDFDEIVVVGGQITLDDLGAIIYVGRPVVFDAGTLDIDSVEQRPVMIESKTVNKLYVKTLRSQGIYVGSEFPKDDTNKGMQDIDEMEIDYTDEDDVEIIANRVQPATMKRTEVLLPGDWKSNGRIAMRGVDPVHFEILSIITDLEELRRE